MSDDLSYFGNLSRFSDTPTLVFSQRKLEESLQRIRQAAQSFSAPARIFTPWLRRILPSLGNLDLQWGCETRIDTLDIESRWVSRGIAEFSDR